MDSEFYTYTLLLGVWTSKLEKSSGEGKAEVVGGHSISRRTARTSNTERAMLVYVITCVHVIVGMHNTV